jgi:ketosteroid isomerase-like protein
MLRLSVLWLVLILGCTRTQDARPRVLAENEIAIRSLMGLWESGQVEELIGLFWPDAVYDDFPNQMQYRGLEEIAGYVQHVHGWATGVTMGVTDLHVSSAVQERPIPGQVPVATGREVVLNGVTIIEMDGGRIRRAADYIDVLPLILQLGGRAELPGGSVITLELDPVSSSER